MCIYRDVRFGFMKERRFRACKKQTCHVNINLNVATYKKEKIKGNLENLDKGRFSGHVTDLKTTLGNLRNKEKKKRYTMCY